MYVRTAEESFGRIGSSGVTNTLPVSFTAREKVHAQLSVLVQLMHTINSWWDMLFMD